MQAVAAPASIRDRAFDICRAHGLGFLTAQRQVTEAGDTIFTDAVIALEAAFGIEINMDELWEGARVADLVALVEAKASDIHRRSLMPANDDGPRFVDRNRFIRPPGAHAVRTARLARAEQRKAKRRLLVRLVLVYPFYLGIAAAVVAFAMGL